MAAEHTRIVAAHVTDEATYQRYRAAMTPILHAHGGAFHYDFIVERTLISHATHPINRVFVIGFPSAAAADALFADPRYLDVRRELFTPSVAATTQIA
jgi:uncharacterized protein (DUF1330 family)